MLCENRDLCEEMEERGSGWLTRAKVCSEGGNDLQSLPKVVQRNKWIMERNISVPLAQGLDVSNFLKDVPRVPKYVSE